MLGDGGTAATGPKLRPVNRHTYELTHTQKHSSPFHSISCRSFHQCRHNGPGQQLNSTQSRQLCRSHRMCSGTLSALFFYFLLCIYVHVCDTDIFIAASFFAVSESHTIALWRRHVKSYTFRILPHYHTQRLWKNYTYWTIMTWNGFFFFFFFTITLQRGQWWEEETGKRFVKCHRFKLILPISAPLTKVSERMQTNRPLRKKESEHCRRRK